jgi:hypothetical protein
MGDSDWQPAEMGVALKERGHSRRLSDKILIAFHFACDQRDFEVADLLLSILEGVTPVTRLMSPSRYNRRRAHETLVAAHERLWQLRHPMEEEAESLRLPRSRTLTLLGG